VSARQAIEPLDAEAANAAAERAGVPTVFTDLNVFRVLLRHERVAKAVNDMLLTLLVRPELDARLRELVIMRLGWSTGSVYEWTQHWPIALRSSLREDEVLAVRDWPTHDSFGDAERAVLAATDETLRDGRVSDATWAACVAHVGGGDPNSAVLIELVTAIGLWRMIAGILRTLGVALEDGVDPWPPDGAAPA
jgi:alkylhydroperoxidase family enzyme